MELEGERHVLMQVVPTMTPRAEGKGVGEAVLGEEAVEKFGPFLETVAIVVAAIEVKRQLGEALRMLG
jgi:hypothetical protein